MAGMQSRKFQFDDFEVDFACGELRKRGVRISLQRKPLRVLELLLRRPGELVTREELVSFLWPDSHVSFEHGLNTAVNSLRLALGESSRSSKYIETRPGLGYRFTALLKEVKSNGTYSDYLKGRYFLDRMCENAAYKSLAFFNSATEDENCSSLARAGIAEVYCQLAQLGAAPPSKLEPLARSAAALAMESGSYAAHAHVAAGRVKMIFDWDWKGAEEAAEDAVALDPASISAHLFRASLLCALGRHKEAKEVCHFVLNRDPLSFAANLELAACLYAAHEYEAATEQCWNVLTLAPRFAPAQLLLALAYQQVGLEDEAQVEFNNASHCVTFQAAAITGTGSWSSLSTLSETRYVSPYHFAVISAAQGEQNEAFRYVEDAVRRRDPALLSLAADPRFDTMRGNARFQGILSEIVPHQQYA